MKNFLLVLLIILEFSSFGQVAIENFNDCNEKIFFVTVEEKPEFNNEGQDLYEYLSVKFEELELLKKCNGKILIGILIFENGETCCKSFANMTNEKINSAEIKKIIDNMPKWKPAIQRGKAVNFVHHQLFKVSNGTIEQNLHTL